MERRDGSALSSAWLFGVVLLLVPGCGAWYSSGPSAVAGWSAHMHVAHRCNGRMAVGKSVRALRCSLYADQEKVIISRGELEEQLMPPPVPLEAAKRGSSAGVGGGGFGAASTSKKGLSKQYAAEAKVLAKELRREGVIRIDNVLSHETADELLAYATELRKQATQEVESGALPRLQRFQRCSCSACLCIRCL